MKKFLALSVVLGPDAVKWLKDQHADTNAFLTLYNEGSAEAESVVEELVEALWVAIAKEH